MQPDFMQIVTGWICAGLLPRFGGDSALTLTDRIFTSYVFIVRDTISGATYKELK